MQLYKWKIDHPIVIDKWNYCTLLLDFLGLAFYYYWIYLCWTFVRHIISYWTFQLMLVFATCIIALDWLLLDQYVLFWMKSYLISCNLLTLQNQPYFRDVQLIQLNFEANNRVTSAFLLRCFGLFQRERQLFLFYKMGGFCYNNMILEESYQIIQFLASLWEAAMSAICQKIFLPICLQIHHTWKEQKTRISPLYIFILVFSLLSLSLLPLSSVKELLYFYFLIQWNFFLWFFFLISGGFFMLKFCCLISFIYYVAQNYEVITP